MLLFSFSLLVTDSDALVASAVRLPVNTIKQLARLGKTSGSKELGANLIRLSEKLPEAQRLAFLEQAYVDILVRQGRLSARKADEVIKNLSGTPGFRSALSKMSGISEAKASGHGFEVLAANALKKNGYKILAIGQRFDDGIKNAMTDIDLIAKKGSRTCIFELKNYHPQSIDYNALINFRGDMQSLNAYAGKHANVRSFFVISSRPVDNNIDKLLRAAAKSQNVELLYADVDTLPMLLEVLK